ncbi:MAG TPA: Uma2 family endonuclease [Candidatus Tyrphobacter sp.]
MQVAPDLGIPEVKPAIESIRGRWEQKVSARRRHSLLQGRLATWLTLWAGDRGEVGTEWRFYMLPKGEKPSSLVPDVAYVSFERMPEAFGELREQPTISPDIAVEVLSPLDRMQTLRQKIAIYLAHGSRLVVVVDPEKRSVTMHEHDREPRTFGSGESALSAEYADLRLDVNALFERI